MTKTGHQKFSALKWKLFLKKLIQKFFRPPNSAPSLSLCFLRRLSLFFIYSRPNCNNYMSNGRTDKYRHMETERRRRKPFKRATDRKSDITKERHKYYIKRATASLGSIRIRLSIVRVV